MTDSATTPAAPPARYENAAESVATDARPAPAETAARPPPPQETDATAPAGETTELEASTAMPPTAARVETGTVELGDGAGGAAPGAFGETLGQGGPVLLVLALLSVAALSILLVKLWQFARLRLNANEPAEQALALWYRHAPKHALAAVQGSPQPTARLLEQAFRGLAKPGVDRLLLREELTRFATAQLEQLRAWLRALEVIAALSPLLGLLGTVLGMIAAFRQLELAGNQVNPALLSGGIWQALLTTAAGLGVAIPVVLLHSWLERRVERCAHQMEDAVTRVFTRNVTAPQRTGSNDPLGSSLSNSGAATLPMPPKTESARPEQCSPEQSSSEQSRTAGPGIAGGRHAH
jgi:biopolymer transport protein ExbB